MTNERPNANETIKLGRLERVPLRSAWSREDSNFTPWLAQQPNLDLLAEALRLGDLELVGEEQSVGPFRADILCKQGSGSLVLIENQLEKTDHTHLGQILTYAAGLDAVTVVWIAAKFTEEHRAALDWLNEVSHEQISFFGLEVELWCIDGSAVAPKFNVVARPNDWSKTVRDSGGVGSTDHQAFLREYWASFCTHLDEVGSSLSSNRKPSQDHWMTWGIGRTGFHLSGSAGSRDKWVAAQFVMEGPEADAHFQLLQRDRTAIESEFGGPLDWNFDPNRVSRYVQVRREGEDPKDRFRWASQHKWMREQLEALDRVFRNRVSNLNAADWDGPLAA